MFRKLLLYFALLLWFVVPAKAQLTIMLPEIEVEPGETIDLEVKVVKEFNAVGEVRVWGSWERIPGNCTGKGLRKLDSKRLKDLLKLDH